VTTVPIFQTRDNLGIEHFFAPAFSVEVGPSLDSLKRLWDVTRVSYKDTVNQIDSFDLTVNNSGWDRAFDEPHYTEFLQDSAGAILPLAVMPGSHARLWMGYQGPMDLYPMLTGRITSVTPTFGGDGGVTLTVRALSSLEALRAAPVKFKWEPRRGQSVIRDTEIAQRIAEKYGIQLVPAPGFAQREAGENSVTQANVTDIAFLIQRARRRGYIVCFRENLPPREASGPAGSRRGGGTPRKSIYFGPSDMLRDQEAVRIGDRPQRFELAWGKSLLDFRPTMNLSTSLWKKVKVNFWNRRTRARIKVEYGLEQLWTDERGVNRDLEPLINLAGLGENEVSGIPVHTEGQARDLARNTLRENFLQLVTAEGSTVGLPELRACSRVEVDGIGSPFNGSYFITSTTHTIDDNGYRTQFSARREQPN